MFRVTDLGASKCWYGFIYTCNQSKFPLNSRINPKMEGIEVFGRDDCTLRLEPG